MKLENTVVALLGALALVAGARLAVAHDEKGVAVDLAHYFPIRTALAADKIDGVKGHAERLAKSEDKDVAKAGEELAKAKDVKAARKVFGDLSKALLAEVDAAIEKGTKVGAVHVFNCPMAKPYGTWLQDSKEIGNPYHGASMLKCGKLVATRGEASEKGHDHEKKHDDHGGAPKAGADEKTCKDGCCGGE